MAGSIVSIAVTLVIGHMSDLSARFKRQIIQQRHVESELQAAKERAE